MNKDSINYRYEGVQFDEIGCGDGFGIPIEYTCLKCQEKIKGGITFYDRYICRKCRNKK